MFMNHKLVAINENILGLRSRTKVWIVLKCIQKHNELTFPALSLIPKLSKTEVIAVFQQATSWFTFAIFSLLKPEFQNDKELILNALKNIDTLNHAQAIISHINNKLLIKDNLRKDIADILILKFLVNKELKIRTAETRLAHIKYMLVYLLNFTKEEAEALVEKF